MGEFIQIIPLSFPSFKQLPKNYKTHIVSLATYLKNASEILVAGKEMPKSFKIYILGTQKKNILSLEFQARNKNTKLMEDLLISVRMSFWVVKKQWTGSRYSASCGGPGFSWLGDGIWWFDVKFEPPNTWGKQVVLAATFATCLY